MALEGAVTQLGLYGGIGLPYPPLEVEPEPEPAVVVPRAGYTPVDRERRRREDRAWDEAFGRGPRRPPSAYVANRDTPVRTPPLELRDELPSVEVEDEEILVELLALGLLDD